MFFIFNLYPTVKITSAVLLYLYCSSGMVLKFNLSQNSVWAYTNHPSSLHRA